MKFKGTILSDKNHSSSFLKQSLSIAFLYLKMIIRSCASYSISLTNQITEKLSIWNIRKKVFCLEILNRYLTAIILKSECSLRNIVRNIVRPKSLLAILISFSNAVTLNQGLVISRLGMCSFCINDLRFITESTVLLCFAQ